MEEILIYGPGPDSEPVPVPRSLLSLPGFSFARYTALFRSRLTILSNTCWGGLTYHRFHLPFLSPTVNMFFEDAGYLDFLEDLDRMLAEEPVFSGTEYNSEEEIEYPVFSIGNVRLHMNHCRDRESGLADWMRRRARVNRANMLVMMQTSSRKNAERFSRLPYPHKICFVPFTSELSCCLTVDTGGLPLVHYVNSLANGTRTLYDPWALLEEGRIALTGPIQKTQQAIAEMTFATLSGADHILIYGAWTLGKQTLSRIKDQFSDRILGFAVSSAAGNPDHLMGFPVRPLGTWRAFLAEQGIDPSKVLTILSLNPQYYGEVEDALRAAGTGPVLHYEDVETYAFRRSWNGPENQTGKITVASGLDLPSAEKALRSGARGLIAADPSGRMAGTIRSLVPLCRSYGASLTDLSGHDLLQKFTRLEQCRYQNGSGWILLAQPYDAVSIVLPDTALVRDVFDSRAFYLRDTFREFLAYCRQRGKTLRLWADPALSLDSQIAPLLDSHIYERTEDAQNDLIVSPRSLSAFRELADRNSGKKILHIGHDLYLDGMRPEGFGIDTYLMRYDYIEENIENESGRAFTEKEYDALLNSAPSENDRRAITLCRPCLFPATPISHGSSAEDPLPLQLSGIEQNSAFGSAVLGPLLCGYLGWLCEELKRTRFDKILFVSRDGWILKELYDRYIAPRTGIGSVYFYTSRHAAFLPVMDDFSRGYIAASASKLSPEEMMRRYYGLSSEEILPWNPAAISRTGYIRRHDPVIRTHAQAARENMLRYFAQAGLVPGGTYALADFIAAGTCQKMLSHFAPFTLTGLYVGIVHSGSGFSAGVRSYVTDPENGVLGCYVNLEYYMTSPEPSLSHFDEDGQPVFFPESRTPEALRRIEAVQDGIRRYAEEWFSEKEVPGAIAPETAGHLCAAGSFLCPKDALIDDWSGQALNGGEADS